MRRNHLFFLPALVFVLACFLGCDKNPVAASDEVVFNNKSDYYLTVSVNGGTTHIYVSPKTNNKFTQVGSSFSVKITYGSDIWPQNQTVLQSDYKVSPGQTVTINSDLSISRS